jgi:hypothetical protein
MICPSQRPSLADTVFQSLSSIGTIMWSSSAHVNNDSNVVVVVVVVVVIP